MSPVHCQLRLVDSRAALPRVVSVLHARGLEVEHLHVEDGRLCALVHGAVPARVLAVLRRVVDVEQVALSSTCVRRAVPQLPTRFLVRREELAG
jgi:hypothetical protein